MFDGADVDYYYKRAEKELEFAQRATHPGVVKAHYLLAGYYLDRVYANDTPAPALADKTSG